jgi:hypothetical protein
MNTWDRPAAGEFVGTNVTHAQDGHLMMKQGAVYCLPIDRRGAEALHHVAR